MPDTVDLMTSTSPRYAVISCGMLGAALLGAIAPEQVARFGVSVWMRAVAGIGIVATVSGIALASPGVASSWGIGSVAGFSVWATASVAELISGVLFLVASFCCAMVGMGIATRGLACDQGGNETSDLIEIDDAVARRIRCRMRVPMVGLWLGGFLRPLAMAWCLPHVPVAAISAEGGRYLHAVYGASAVSQPGSLAAACSFVLLTGLVGAVACMLVLRGSEAVSRHLAVAVASGCAASYAAGGLVWYLLAQIVSVGTSIPDAVSLTGYAASVLLYLLVIATLLWERAKPREETCVRTACACTAEAAAADTLGAPRFSFDGMGLTPREGECLNRALAGSTSEQTASELGIGASTVRAYLQRAYRKLGVSSLPEARERMVQLAAAGDAEAIKYDEQSASATAGDGTSSVWGPARASVRARILRDIHCALFAACAVLLSFPDFDQREWGAGAGVACAVAAVALGFATRAVGDSVLAVSSNAWSFGAYHEPKGTCGMFNGASRVGVFIALVGALFSGALLVLLRAWVARHPFVPLIPWYGADRGLEAVAFALFCVSGAAWAKTLMVGEAAHGETAARPLSLAIGAGAGVLLLASPGDMLFAASLIVLALCAVTGAIAALPALRAGGDGGDAVGCEQMPATSPVVLDRYALPALGLLALIGGFAWEEVWREHADLSFALGFAPFLCACCIVSLWAHRCMGGSIVSLCACSCSAIVITACMGYLVTALCAFSIVLGLGICLRLRRRVIAEPGVEAACLVLVAAGLIGGFKAVNAFGDISLAAYQGLVYSFDGAVMESVPASGVGDLRGALLACGSFCIAAGMVACLLLLVALVRDVLGELEAQRQLAEASLDDARIRSYLVGRGLNGTQIDVMLLTLRGCTAGDIAAKLFLSVGTVNSARDAAHRLLRVHNRLQLIALLRRDAGM